MRLAYGNWYGGKVMKAGNTGRDSGDRTSAELEAKIVRDRNTPCDFPAHSPLHIIVVCALAVTGGPIPNIAPTKNSGAEPYST